MRYWRSPLAGRTREPKKARRAIKGRPVLKDRQAAAGPAGMSGTIIRFVDSECRQVCTVACEEDERILSSHAINPGGTFTFEADNSKATFRPQRQGVPIRVVVACVKK